MAIFALARKIPVPHFDLSEAEIAVHFEAMDDGPTTEDFDAAELADVDRRLLDGDTGAWCEITVAVRWRGFAGLDFADKLTLRAEGYDLTEILRVANGQGLLSGAIRSLRRVIADNGWTAAFPSEDEIDAVRIAPEQAVTYGPYRASHIAKAG